MNINWTKIKADFSQAYKLFLKYKYNMPDDLINSFMVKNICYCDIESFMDEQCIIIFFSKTSNCFNDPWMYCIRTEFDFDEELESHYEYKSRIEAKVEATYKAFSILNEQL